MGKASQLDQHNVAAASTRTTPMVSLDRLQDVVNLLVAANIVAGSIPLLTAKLDVDTGVTDTNYAALINPLTTGDVVAKFNTLLAKLDADTLVGDTNYAALLTATIDNLRPQYLALLAKLDADSGVTATNHGTTALLADFASLLVIPLDSQ